MWERSINLDKNNLYIGFQFIHQITNQWVLLKFVCNYEKR